MSRVVLLGPQRLHPTIGEEVAAAGLPTGPLAVVTAGWQEREGEDQELRADLAPDVLNLGLYSRGEVLAKADPEYFKLHRARQDRLRTLQRFHRRRLGPALSACRSFLSQKGPAALLEPEREDAIQAVRALDQHHLRRVRSEMAEFEERVRPGEREHIARQRAEVAAVLQGCAALLIAGGHVAVLLNRLELFGVPPVLGERPVFAWSAGAMALTERVVLFHDSPPQGAGDPEILGRGLGLVPDVVVLPGARHRLRLTDPARVALLARRFAPARCVPLDEGDRLTWDGASLVGGPGARWMSADGDLGTGATP